MILLPLLYAMGVLTVVLDRVENLRDSDSIAKSDPYIKFHLEQDNYVFDKNYGKKQSSKKTNELSPEYHETFTFKYVPSLKNMVLHVRVMDDDIGLDDQIGYCKIKLDGLGLSSESRKVKRVVDKKTRKNSGSIFTPYIYASSFCYNVLRSLWTNPAVVHLKISYDEDE